MPFRRRTAAIVLIVLTALAVLVRIFFSSESNLERYAGLIEREIAQREREAAVYAGELHISAGRPAPSPALLQASWGLKFYNIAWYQGDSLIYQLNSKFLPWLPADAVNEEVVFQQDNRVYLGKPLSCPGSPAIRALAWIPVWEEGAGFSGLPRIPANVMPSFGYENWPPVRNAQGEKLFSLMAEGPVRDPTGKSLLAILLLGIALATVYILNGVATGLVRKYSPWAGALFLILVAAALQMAMRWPWLQEQWEMLGMSGGVFQQAVQHQTLGGLLLNSVLLLWFMIFFHRHFEEIPVPPLSRAAAFGLSAVNYLAILMGMIVVAQTVRNMVFFSDLNIFLDNIFQMDAGGLAGILVLMLLLLAFFLFSHRMTQTIVGFGLPPALRIASFGVALAISIPFFWWTGIPLPVSGVVLAAIVFVVTLDLFADTTSPSLTWMIFLLILVSLLPSLMLSSFRLAKEDEVQQQVAIQLSGARDPLAEDILRNFPDSVRNIGLWLGKNSYLSAFYQLDTARRSANSDFSVIDSLDGMPAYTFGSFGTLVKTAHSWQPPLPALLNPLSYKGIHKLDDYEYAIYYRGALTDQSPNSLLPNRVPADLPEAGAATRKTLSDGSQIEWLFHNPNGNVAIVRRSVDDLSGPISLASYMMAIFFLIIPVLGLINHWFPFLPPSLEFLHTRRPAMSARIQLWVVGFLLGSFVLVGLISIWNFRKNSDENQGLQIRAKTDAIRTEAARQIRERHIQGTGPELYAMLGQLGRLHKAELLVYDPEGRLMRNAAPALDGERWFGEYMPGNIRYSLVENNTAFILESDRAGKFPVQVVYFPVRTLDGGISAFLALPFIDQPSSLQKEISAFLSSLISVYVSLLVFAGALAIFIANSTTRPISQLGESLRKLKLGKNEPLEYQGDDELGALIEEYNRTLQKLEESTTQLAASERETGWRQVARQVAHEINNPLTPMSLDIQRLQMAVKMRPEKAGEIAEEVSGQIMEQISVLKGIASSFAHFGQMPQTELSVFSLSELVAKVHGLFRNTQSTVEFNLSLPEEPCEIEADKYQIARVFNNLYKNAIQAIPEDREGMITGKVVCGGGKVQVEVRDNGTGIPEEMREKVFEPNFTTKTSGSGLGLAMSKSMVEAAKGRIWVESEPGKGTSFFVEFPLAGAENS
jgi:two-component system nitrogen regulation sensor histidine kinase NtrY